ncbi:bifunctional metallophosphatase/5'-nucleotidase [Dyadobacter tibetensis]|uniref:bifunctional metallophosphatase/5'-nucleotidase n=1 Tax=Dyadobacter tibetensis TaxID=1211851 RepID=UPI000A045490|nr:metallophosphatase [Dyadobacter tibetensis]
MKLKFNLTEESASMKTSRRDFLKMSASSFGLAGLTTLPYHVLARPEIIQLTILHTNDVHSRIEPFPMDGSRNQGLGGVARRATLINSIRKQQDNVLLLDAGDIFQGTPYFNLFGGELEMKLMTDMGYDAATMGNHDFDNGLQGFLKQLPHAKFPFLTSNYDFSDTILKGKTQDYQVFVKQGLRIGVFGLGIELEGLVDKKNYLNTLYLDPLKKANEMSDLLKHDLRCDLIICLSHLGYKYREQKISDVQLAALTRNIDLIIGGHTHTFLKQPEDIVNTDGKITTVNQVGFAGINLGRIDYYFNREKREKSRVARTYPVGPEISETFNSKA